MATEFDKIASGFSSSGADRVGTLESIFSGVVSGAITIPKGFFSLGATLLDLGAGTNKAAEVEAFFDDLTTFDEKAEATTAGEIARIITNLGIPGTVAFKTGSRLTKQALAAKKNNTYFQIDDKTGKLLEDSLTAKGKALTTLGGVGGIGFGVGVGGIGVGGEGVGL